MNLNLTGNAPSNLSVSNNPSLTYLSREFFNRNTLTVCKDLLGKKLCKLNADGSTFGAIITEVEAYRGPEDRACHAYGFKPSPKIPPGTRRWQVLFGPPGHWYVYLCYGVHEMLNIVTEDEGYPAAILIRAVHTASGPGRVTRAFGVDRRYNRQQADPQTGLWIADSGVKVTSSDYERTPRIGVDYAGPVWAAKPYRFVMRADRLQKRLSQVVI